MVIDGRVSFFNVWRGERTLLHLAMDCHRLVLANGNVDHMGLYMVGV